MGFNPDIHHRRSIRLRGYDYSQPGWYFVTICTHQRACLFGEVVDGRMVLNAAGMMAESWWLELTNKFPSVCLDQYIIMPNHIHGVVQIVGADLCVCPRTVQGAHAGAPLHAVVQWFKTMTTNAYIRGVRDRAWVPFEGRLWQRNYHEHIIRNEQSATAIRAYVDSNPAGWHEDSLHPGSGLPLC